MGFVGRRQFLVFAGSLLAAPLSAQAQQAERQYVVGTLISGGRVEFDMYLVALRERLARHGLVEGRNLRFEHRVGLDPDGAFRATREFAAMKVDAIFACHTTTTEGVKRATKSVPAVFTWVEEPVLLGIVSDYARPGGNLTGVTSRIPELLQKRLELAVELAPKAKRVGALFSGVNNNFERKSFRPKLFEAAAQKGVELIELSGVYRGALAIERAHQAGAKVVLTLWHFLSTGNRYSLENMIQRSRELRMALLVVGADEAEAGALIAYGTDILDDLRRAADMLAKVLKGENPGNLPVDQASRFQLVLNLKTAKEIGLSIPRSIVVRADRLIE